MEDQTRRCKKKKKKLIEYQRNLCDQKVQITKSILDFEDTELEEKISCSRDCKPGCKIFHSKHNWSKTYSSKYIDDLECISNVYVVPRTERAATKLWLEQQASIPKAESTATSINNPRNSIFAGFNTLIHRDLNCY